MSYRDERVQCGNGHTIFWMPVLGPDDEPYDKERFPPHIIANLKNRPQVWDSQYMLRKPGEHDTVFDEAKIREAMFRWADPRRIAMRYEAFELDPDNLDEHGLAVPTKTPASVSLAHCRFYMHVDAKHKLESQERAKGKNKRPSKDALTIIAVAPDHHVFLVDYWSEAVGLEGLAAKMFRYYTLWAPSKVTWESIGAQFWLKEYIEKLEHYDARYRFPVARTRYGVTGELPRLSTRMVEGQKTNESKEFVANAWLSGWVNSGALHLDSDRYDEVLHQLLSVLDDSVGIDLVDCIGQGPPVWKAPPEPSAFDQAARRRAFVTAFVQPRTGFLRRPHPADGQGRTGFKRPWA